MTWEPQMGDLETLGAMFTPVVSHVHMLGEGVTLEQLRHCLSVLISARQDVDSSLEGSVCVVVCRTEISCHKAALSGEVYIQEKSLQWTRI